MNSYETTDGETREQALMRLIRDSRYEMQLPALAPSELEATMKAWLRRLSPVPSERLQRCFDFALERHTKRSALIPAQILEAWMAVRGEIEDALRFSEREQCEYACSSDGWALVDASGNLTTNFSEPVFARACPIHRPQGWRIGEMTDKNYRRDNRSPERF